MHGLRKALRIETRLRRQHEQLLRQVEQEAPVAIGHGTQRRAGIGIERQWPVLGGFGTLEQLLQCRIGQPVQHQHLRPRQKCGIQFERRVFRRRADQHHSAVLDKRQKAILLSPVEPVDFVDEKQCRAAVLTPLLRRVKGLAQISHARKYR